MDNKHTLPCAAMLFSLACGFSSLVCLFLLSSGGSAGRYPFTLLPFSLLVYLANRLFLRRERSMALLALLNLLFSAAFTASVPLLDSTASPLLLSFAALFALTLCALSAYLCLVPPSLFKVILALDLSAFLLLALTAFLSLNGLSLLWTLPSCVGCASAVTGVVSRRVCRRLGGRDWGILLLVLSGLSVLLWILIRFVAAPAGQGVLTLGSLLLQGIKLILLLFWKAFVALLSLMPEPNGQTYTPPTAPEILIQEEAVLAADPLAVVLLLCLIAVAGMCALVVILAKMGKLRIGGTRTSSATGRSQRQRLSLLRALALLFAEVGTTLRTRLFLWKNRNTPEGLFYTLVHRCRMSPWHKKTGETPREFLSRLREGALEDEKLLTALDALIPAVEASLYSPAPKGQSFPAARLVRRRIGGAARRQYLRSQLHKRK